MAEPPDSDALPTQTWPGSGGSPPAPTPGAATTRDEPRRSGWQPPEPDQLQASFPQYEIRGVLGRGGMGAVYQGWQKSLRRFVAIKILPPGIEDHGANFAERFQREAQAMARFSHPGIVAVHDAGQTPEGLLYFVMEYVEGTDVQRMVRQQGPLAPEHALAITAHVCDALAYAHKRGVIHRDIKPSNIMVDTEGRVKVADFGLAKLVTDNSAAAVTNSHLRMGTPDFMAPEAMQGMAQVDHRADLYAVGVMLYQMLTGAVPRGRFELPSRRVPGLDVRVDAIVDRALQSDPEKRYSTASEICTDLARILPTPASQISLSPSAPADAEGASRPASNASSSGSLVGVLSSPQSARRGRVWLYSILAGGALVAVGAPFYFRLPWREPEAGSPPATFSLEAVEQLRAAIPREELPLTFGAVAKEDPFVNSLGMKFVPVAVARGPLGNRLVLFSVWETRVRDYTPFAEANTVDPAWMAAPKQGMAGNRWPDEPACGVSWKDAKAFCQWLTEKEIREGVLPAGMRYRLPTDEEWSRAIGLAEEKGATPAERSEADKTNFPWGTGFPPSRDMVGNYADTAFHAKFPKNSWIDGYADGFPYAAPVGSFAANPFGLHDLGGNAWEWCEDAYEPGSDSRVWRGGSWGADERRMLLSSHRREYAPHYRDRNLGFRPVLEVDATARRVRPER